MGGGDQKGGKDGDGGGRDFDGPEGSDVPTHALSRLHSDPRIALHLYRKIQRKRREAQAAEPTTPPEGGELPTIKQTGGAPLDAATRQRIEPHVGGDLSAVRVHTDAASGRAAGALGAKAFAEGSNIHFGEGQFAPGTAAGDALLAHEATHVVQQHGGVRLSPERLEGEQDAAERQADVAGARAAAALHYAAGGDNLDVGSLSKSQKLLEAIKRSTPYLGKEAALKIASFLTPGSLETLTAVMVGGAVVQAIPVIGEVADVALASWAIYSLGNEAIHASKEMFAFVKGALAASSAGQLNEAGHHFANFVTTVGVDGAIAFLLHRTAKDISAEVNRAAEGGPPPAVPLAAARGFGVSADGTIVELGGEATEPARPMSSEPRKAGAVAPSDAESSAGSAREPAASVRNERPERRVSGARKLHNDDFDGADAAYAEIRANPQDVEAIAKNTGIATSRVQRIKDHVFEKNHSLDDGPRRFDADPEIANAWRRLEAGNVSERDLMLLDHELFESKFEGIFKTDYRTAHAAANRSGRPSGLE